MVLIGTPKVSVDRFAVGLSNTDRMTMIIMNDRVTGLYKEDCFCIYHDEVIQSPQYGLASLESNGRSTYTTAKSVLSPEVISILPPKMLEFIRLLLIETSASETSMCMSRYLSSFCL